VEAFRGVADVELARVLIEKLAPEEQELFAVISAAYQRDPDRFANPARGRDEMLGFGVEVVSTLLTPVLLSAVSEVTKYLATEISTRTGLRAWLQRRFGRTPSTTALTGDHLTPEQLTRVREIVLAKCRQAELPKGKATLVADGVVGALNPSA
jgi:hypothetical protein